MQGLMHLWLNSKPWRNRISWAIIPAQISTREAGRLLPRSSIFHPGDPMKTLALFFLILACAVVCTAQRNSKCFRGEWLQGERTVTLKVNGSKVSGTFTVGSGDDPDRKTYSLNGTRRGNALTVTFAENKRPDVSPSELKSLVWTLVRRGNHESLRIKVFGKNYNTNKYENSFAYFEPCEPATQP
jgi:hypothetical protein